MAHVLGMVVEYNPLHNGHHYHFIEGKKRTGATFTVAVMSGHFLQRGEPALIDKWKRTELALQLGVDLVLELPVIYATQNAERFAFGAIATLDALGVVDSLCFGSEIEAWNEMMAAAQAFVHEPERFRSQLQSALKQGHNYPHASAVALQAWAEKQGLPIEAKEWSQPNNRLGFYYCIALARLQSSIIPFNLKRWKADYHQREVTDHAIASATAIRQLILAAENHEQALASIQPYVPSFTYQLLQQAWDEGYPPLSWEHFYPQLLSQIITNSHEELASFLDVTEGLEYRIKKMAPTVSQVEHLIEAVKSKRYTWTRIQRAFTHILLRYTEEEARQFNALQHVPYIRVLGMSRGGQTLLQQAKKVCPVPIITKIGRKRHPMLEKEIQASMLYATAMPPHLRPQLLLRDFQQPPLRPPWELGQF